MKNFIYNLSIIILGASLLFSTSCTDDFDEINTSPNNPLDVPNINLLAYSIVELGDRFNIDDELLYAASYVGHVARAKNNTANSYNTNPPEGMWSSYYVRSLKNLNIIIETDSEKEQNIKAAAKVLKAYATMIHVDAYGDAPYFEAAKLDSGVTNVAYDPIEDIYDHLFMMLEEANEEFDGDENNFSSEEMEIFTSNDILFGDKVQGFAAEILKWRKFANSLRLRLATRINKVNKTKSDEIISTILNDTDNNPIFEDNDDSAILLYPGDDWLSP